MDQNAEARCSQCGRPTTRSYEALEAAIAQYRAQGYLLESRGSDWAQLKRRDPTKLILGIWYFVVAALLFGADPVRVLIWLDADGTVRLDEPPRFEPPAPPPRRTWDELSSSERIKRILLWVLAGLFAAWIIGVLIWQAL